VRPLVLTAAALIVPALWGCLVPPLLARVWPRRQLPGERPPLPDYEI
jgi:hypothetical protein